jgi:predicted MFS family arabinose efflux permease
MYALGILGMAAADGALALHLFGGVLTGLGVAFTAFTLAMAAMARVVGPQRRSLVLGLGTAAGSFGQVVFTPLGRMWIDMYGWDFALMLLAASAVILIPLAFCLPSGTQGKGEAASDQTMAQALREALAHRGFVLLTLGLFVCGYQVAFITIHFPAYVSDIGLGTEVGAFALALIGLFNIAGAIMSGAVGQRWSKKGALSAIYFARSFVILGLMLAPKTELTIYLFAGAMGILWLSTVPLTSGIVAQIFGLRYMATLFGIVFLSHQLGSFLGIWLGGRLYDATGSYDIVWWTGAALGIAAAFVHLPINEKPLNRLTPQAAE